MRPSRAWSSGPAASCHMLSSVDCITTTSESEFSVHTGEPLDRPGAKRVLMRAVELGITLIDTADAYGPEVNERFIAETLYPYPKGLIIATKGGLRRPRREAWENNGRPEHLRAACEASLRRLKLERIDIYQLHAPDPQVPLDES